MAARASLQGSVRHQRNGEKDLASTLERQIRSFDRWLQYENKSDKTRTIYGDAARIFATWVSPHGVTDWATVEPEHIRDFIISVLETGRVGSPGYASNLFRSLQQFAKWHAAEYNVANPMAGLKPPMVPEQLPPVLREEELNALLKSCAGREFLCARDTAILYLFMDSGIRRGELAGLAVDDLDLDHREVTVLGKGRRTRTVSYGRKAAWSLDRYLETRGNHRQAEAPELWLGEKGKGPMTGSGIFQMIQRRGERVGIKGLHPHTLRHTWAHMLKKAHVSPEEHMALAGWKSPQMLARYAASTAAERARETGKRLAPGDRL
jgi:integrase/recombinase XerC